MIAEGFDYAWAYGRERGARQWVTQQLRDMARGYNPDPGAPGEEVEGRVIASDLYMLAQILEDGMADLDARREQL